MEKLMKPAEYAKELGISRQAVYAKIKRGILTAKDVDGKLYIVVDNIPEKKEATSSSSESEPSAAPSQARRKSSNISSSPSKDYEALLAAKDETINVLKSTVKDLKKSNKQISTTLRGEIDLLKEAFHEMRTLYVNQLEQHKPQDAIDVLTEEVESIREPEWIGVKRFFKVLGIKKSKVQEKMLKRLKKAWKEGDVRITKIDGKLKLDASCDFTDFVN
jgi:predicted DNA-binding protein YlxM (UPF0122 family)